MRIRSHSSRGGSSGATTDPLASVTDCKGELGVMRLPAAEDGRDAAVGGLDSARKLPTGEGAIKGPWTKLGALSGLPVVAQPTSKTRTAKAENHDMAGRKNALRVVWFMVGFSWGRLQRRSMTRISVFVVLRSIKTELCGEPAGPGWSSRLSRLCVESRGPVSPPVARRPTMKNNLPWIR